jgi:ketosteroid isomerase-like protein
MVRHVSNSERKGAATMGHPNEGLIRRDYDAFSRGDMDTLRELFDRDIVWHAPGRSQLAGDHQGVEAVLGYFGQTMELTGGNFRVEVHDVVANDEHAVGLNSVHAERAGRTLEDNNTLVFHVRDGKVTEVWQYWADQYAADELFA